eukprot:c22829_g1_i1.p1 GENE.c22829_g1_i1~~c22829_g1_i1.p1  ORF type:complete len:282 (+),score=47.30 c22829_g1_i1:33-878(+)
MGSLLAKVAFLPPKPTYSEASNLFFVTTRLKDKVPYFYHNNSASLTILFFHANAEDIGMANVWIEHLGATLKVNVAAVEYPGYGLASGTPSEEGTLAAAEACLEDLHHRHGIRTERCVVWGRSLGSGPAVHLASKFPVRGLILQSAFTSILRVPLGLNNRVEAPFDMFPNIHKIHQVQCPVFVLHGTADEVCPVSHGLALFAACAFPWFVWIIPLAEHDNIEIEHLNQLLQYSKQFLNFVETYWPPGGHFENSLDELVATRITTQRSTRASIRRASGLGCV